MANKFNILAEKFGNSTKNFFNYDPQIWIKLTGWSEFKPLGYTDVQKSFKQSKEWDELKAGKPSRLIHKTPKEINRNFEAKLWQYQKETIALTTGGYIDNTDPALPRVIYGSEDFGAIECSLILKGKSTSGKRIELYIRKGLITSEDIETAIGDSYSSLDFKLDVVEDDDPLLTNYQWPIYGTVSFTATTTTGSEKLGSVSSLTGLEAGMMIYTPDGFKSKIESVSTDITLEDTFSSDVTDQEFKAIKYDDMQKDNIAFWLLEE